MNTTARQMTRNYDYYFAQQTQRDHRPGYLNIPVRHTVRRTGALLT